ncbi:glycosyltransferase family 1 protein [Variovorax dokdonensis]|uniref:Glycosyltransferase family 1 protein n=1 Tax=Variovorax dokdonensis TaxID=344883 RepID=A0ABT7N5W2_9BURK|nr:glycosyltransferase family 1 protein [Variovorax dokdonensis]MDM0043333.1 glycosyltransferase family 1 protein [Variovorax dokdonensis]
MSNNPIEPTARHPDAAIRLVINGKFLQPSTSRSGVYRVAREMLVALDRMLADDPALAARVDCRLMLPRDQDPGLPLSRIQVERRQDARRLGSRFDRFYGVLWEQTVLPWRSRGATLISLCNIGPVARRDAFTMVHDAQVYSSPASYSLAFRSWYRLVLPLLGRRNRSLLTVSGYSKAQLVQFGVAEAERIRVIHNGCDHVKRLVPDADAVHSLGLNGDQFVLALANLQPHKNIAMLLQAFESQALANVTLALFGPAKREDFERQGHVVPPNVRFLGFVSDEQLAGLLKAATALAFPSTTEGFGLPPLEAMLLGCPTIAAPCGALPEVCGDAVLWADARSPDQWAEQILRCCIDPALRDEMRARGRGQAARFTWARAVEGLLATVSGVPQVIREYEPSDRETQAREGTAVARDAFASRT